MIVIAPFAKKLTNGKNNPKNYPFWDKLLPLVKDHVVQVGVSGEERLVEDVRFDLSIQELRGLIHECKTWISCDSFFQHLAWDEGKRGIVLWSVSDPLIYGHPENINLLKSKDCLSTNQFLWWESVEHDPNKFVEPDEVLRALQNHF